MALKVPVKQFYVSNWPARRPSARREGVRDAPRRRAGGRRGRHGDQHRGAQVQGLCARRTGHPRRRPGRRQGRRREGDSRDDAPHA